MSSPTIFETGLATVAAAATFGAVGYTAGKVLYNSDSECCRIGGEATYISKLFAWTGITLGAAVMAMGAIIKN